MAIQGFAAKAIGKFFLEGTVPKRAGWGGVARIAARKLDILDYAAQLSDMASPPGNRLEALKGNRAGYHGNSSDELRWRDGRAKRCNRISSINRRRTVFRWERAGPLIVDIVHFNRGLGNGKTRTD